MLIILKRIQVPPASQVSSKTRLDGLASCIYVLPKAAQPSPYDGKPADEKILFSGFIRVHLDPRKKKERKN